MNQSEQIDKLVEALAKAQGSIENPQKNKKVQVSTRSGSDYSFEYADLTAIIEAIKKPLSENGLAYVQILGQDEQSKYRLTTRLLHSSGQWIASETPLFVDGSNSQAFGSALTFMKRYALAALLGVAADSDDDANAADGNSAKVQDRAPRKPKEPAPNAINPPSGQFAGNPLLEAPHAIPVKMDGAGKTDWIGFGQSFLLAAQGSSDPATADAWLRTNQDALQTAKSEAPKVYKRLAEALLGVFPQGLDLKG